jgi:hypothetical protein
MARDACRAASGWPWRSLAFLLEAMGRFDEAIAVAESALSRDSLCGGHWAATLR